jgi:hypothetical protein
VWWRACCYWPTVPAAGFAVIGRTRCPLSGDHFALDLLSRRRREERKCFDVRVQVSGRSLACRVFCGPKGLYVPRQRWNAGIAAKYRNGRIGHVTIQTCESGELERNHIWHDFSFACAEYVRLLGRTIATPRREATHRPLVACAKQWMTLVSWKGVKRVPAISSAAPAFGHTAIINDSSPEKPDRSLAVPLSTVHENEHSTHLRPSAAGAGCIDSRHGRSGRFSPK